MVRTLLALAIVSGVACLGVTQTCAIKCTVLEPLGCDSGGFYIEFDSKGYFLATVSDPPENVVRVWNISTFELVQSFRPPPGFFFCGVCFSPDSGLLAAELLSESLPRICKVVIWRISTGSEVCVLEEAHSMQFSPDGEWLATAYWRDRTIKLWKTEDWQLGKIFRSDVAPLVIPLVIFSPNGNMLFTTRGGAVLFDLVNNKKLVTFADCKHPRVFSPNGKWLVEGSDTGEILVWDVETGLKSRVLTGHTGRIISLSFGPNGYFLASTAKDHTLKLWDFPSGQEICHADLFEVFGLEKVGEQRLIDKITNFLVEFHPDETLLALGVRTLNPTFFEEIPATEDCPCVGAVFLCELDTPEKRAGAK